MGFNEGDNDHTKLKNKGLCLVPLSMIVKYIQVDQFHDKAPHICMWEISMDTPCWQTEKKERKKEENM